MLKKQQTLKPQDIFILLKIVASGAQDWSYGELAHELVMSSSEVHQGVKRAIGARLMDAASRKPIMRALEEFIVHGLKYAFPVQRGGPTRGMQTAYAAPPLQKLLAHGEEMIPVWPDPEGRSRGYELTPLYRTAPKAAGRDPELYVLLALVDSIRAGRGREREFAVDEMRRRFHRQG